MAATNHSYQYVIGVRGDGKIFLGLARSKGLECNGIGIGYAKEIVVKSIKGETILRSVLLLRSMKRDIDYFLVIAKNEEDKQVLLWLLRHPDVAFVRSLTGSEEDEGVETE